MFIIAFLFVPFAQARHHKGMHDMKDGSSLTLRYVNEVEPGKIMFRMSKMHKVSRDFHVNWGAYYGSLFGQRTPEGSFHESSGDARTPFNFVDRSNGGVQIYKAYGSWKAKRNWTVNVGRMPVMVWNVINPNYYFDIPVTFDGIKVGYNHKMADIDYYNLVIDRSGDNSNKLSIVNVNMKRLFKGAKKLNFYYIMNEDNTVANPTDETRYGVNIAGSLMKKLGYKFAYASVSSDNAEDANMMDLKLYYDLDRTHTVMVNYHKDSGDSADTSVYNPMYYNAHYKAGLMDIVGWGQNDTGAGSGLTQTSFGLKSKWGKYHTKAVYHMFSYTEPGSAEDIGTEIDLSVHRNYGKNFKTGLRLGQFSYDDDRDSESQVEVSMSWMF